MDLQAFWSENEVCLSKPFSTDKPRAALTLPFDDHWLLEEMQVPSTMPYYVDGDYKVQLERECNDRCEDAVGLRPFSETPPTPQPLRIEELFGSKKVLTEGATPWLEPGHSSPGDLSAKLDELEGLSESEVGALACGHGASFEGKGEVRVWSRGPTTVACSVLGPERMLYWLMDHPALMHRYFEVFASTVVKYHKARGRQITGVGWLDDFCALLSPELYREFALPSIKSATEAFAPNPDNFRFQHSDSAMAHLLPVLSELNYHGVNLGPTVSVTEIRKHMPKTMIHGQVPPFLLRNGSLEEVEAMVIRDFQAVGHDGGLVVTTAGSIAAGTTLDRVRWLMECVTRNCRYD